MRTLATHKGAALVQDDGGDFFVKLVLNGKEILVDAGGYATLLETTADYPDDADESRDTAIWVIDGVFEALRAGLPGTVSVAEDEDLTFYRSRPRTVQEIIQARNRPTWRDVVNAGLSVDDVAALVGDDK